MSKTIEQIESRLRRLEKEVSELKAALPRPAKVPWYRQIVGEFAGDDAYREIVRLGRLARRGKLES